MHDALSDSDHAFLVDVGRKLAELYANDDPRTITQDQLDVLMLGGTVPAIAIPQPDPECADCWGTGWVCPCHGVCAAHGARGPRPGERGVGCTARCRSCLPRWYVERATS